MARETAVQERVTQVARPRLLEVESVSKTFGGVVRALDDVNLVVHENEILGVVGQNGAGKTTLMKILVGAHAPDEGTLRYRGASVPFPQGPKEAAKRGISIVYQEKGVIPSLSVYQFLFLGHEEKYRGRFGLDTRRLKSEAKRVLKQFDVRCGVDDAMHELPLSTQKMVEIARAILTVRLEQEDAAGKSVVILDEPTAPLNIEEREELLRAIAAMKSDTSFIFVTHIMQEVMEFMDRVMVLRDGKLVGEYDMASDAVTEEALTKVILGRESLLRQRERAAAPSEGTVVMAADKLTRQGSYYGISFELHQGECLGIFGPAGSGKSEVLRTLAGLMAFDGGTLLIKGERASPGERPHARLERGVGYLSGETAKELLHEWPIAKNISLLNMDKIVGRYVPVMRFSEEASIANSVIDKLKIRAPDAGVQISALSGGNKQKVTVGKWFERRPDILLLEDPTIGIDVGSRVDIFDTLLGMKEQGTSVVLVSDEAKEYAVLCDKVLLLKQGRQQELLSSDEFKEVIET